MGLLALEQVLGKKTLIYGEVGVGKTRLLARLMEMLVQRGFGESITIVDMAPKRIGEAGGEVTEYLDVSGLRYLRPSMVYAPRLQACNSEDVLRYVSHNVKAAEELLQIYYSSPTDILAVNDVSIYLQGRDSESIMKYVFLARTFLGTCYYGLRLEEDYGSGVSRWERMQVEKLLNMMDNKVRLE